MVPLYTEITDEGIGIYPIWKKYTFFFPTLDGLASILNTKISMNFLHLIILLVKSGSGFYLFSETKMVRPLKGFSDLMI